MTASFSRTNTASILSWGWESQATSFEGEGGAGAGWVEPVWVRQRRQVCSEVGAALKEELGTARVVHSDLCVTNTHASPARRRQGHPTPVLLPRECQGQRSLVSCSPWDCEESDMTEQLHFHFSLSCIEEGNGNPLQYSCLENPRDGGARWAAVYGVVQSRT